MLLPVLGATTGIIAGAASAAKALQTASKRSGGSVSPQQVLSLGKGPLSASGYSKALASGAVSAGVSQSSGSSSSQATSASGQYDLDSLLSRLQSIAGQNSALSAQQAEDLRRWQEIQNAKAMEFNAAEAVKNRDWQKMMSDTAHQREIADLQAAGLNPVLSAMGGQGAYAGSGATAAGVTSSGAQGQVDMAASSGLVQLLGSLVAAQTSLANAALSAKTNESIADKANATSRLVSLLTGQFGLARERLSGEYGLKRQYESDVWANWRTGQTSAATRYAADQSRAASKYFADTQYGIHRDFPQTGFAALASAISQLLQGKGPVSDVSSALASDLGDVLSTGSYTGSGLGKSPFYDFANRNAKKEDERYKKWLRDHGFLK